MKVRQAWLKKAGQLGWFNVGHLPGVSFPPVLAATWSGVLGLSGASKVTLTLAWFFGAVIAAVVSALRVRCPVCGWRPVALGPMSNLNLLWLQDCSHCGDDGSGRQPVSRDSPRWGGRKSDRQLRQLAWALLSGGALFVVAPLTYLWVASPQAAAAKLAHLETATSCEEAADVVRWNISDAETSWFLTACNAVKSDGETRTVTLHLGWNFVYEPTVVVALKKEANALKFLWTARR